MSLPRIEIMVTERAPSGWDVHVDGRDSHRMDAVEVAAGGVPIEVPARAGFDLEGLLRRLATRVPDSGDVTRYGQWLFDCLLGPVWPGISGHRAMELALDLPLGLQHLCWEAMHDGTAPLAGHPQLLVAFTRLVSGPLEPPQTLTRIPRVLFAVGAKQTDEVIRPGAMFAGMLQAFDSCVIRNVSEVSLERLGEMCQEFRPDIVHLVAHGELDEHGRGVVRLAGQVSGVCADRLLPALTAGGAPLAVLLSACSTGLATASAAPLAAELVADGIWLVSAMSGEVSEPACRLYTRRFVHAVGAGLPVAKAVAQGRRAALLALPPGEHLDWAMPAMFAARSIDPGFQLLDPAEPRKVLNLAKSLRLRKPPVFIGRDDILQRLGDLFHPDPDQSLGFIGLVRDGELTGLGGTRLLREIGFRLLRAGHIPVFLGPYRDQNAPRSLRVVAAGILDGVAKIAKEQGAVLPGSSMLGIQATSHKDFLIALGKFLGDQGSFQPDIARIELGADLTALAGAIGAAGAPFKPDARIVVLADSLHWWIDVVDDLLEMINAFGLGTIQDPLPVIATYSLTAGKGPALKTFMEDNIGPGFAFPPLGPLTDEEAILGFQWVLLNPWGDHKNVYVCRDEKEREPLAVDLRRLNGSPCAVDYALYLLAETLADREHLIRADDDAVYRQYESRHP